MDALKRARSVALHFEPSGPDYVFEPYVDGNGNGVRTAEIRSGVDPSIGAGQRLSERFPGVTFGLQAGLPDADGVRMIKVPTASASAPRAFLRPDRTALRPRAPCMSRVDARSTRSVCSEPQRGRV